MNTEISQDVSEERLGISEKIKCYFVNPKRFFQDSKKKSSWVILFLLIVISALVLQVKVFTITASGLDLGAGSGQDSAAIVAKVAMLVAVITGIIVSVVTIFLSSLVIRLCVKYALKGDISYKQVLSVYCFSNIPIIILNLISIAIYSIIGTSSISTDLVTTLIRQVNPLTIWSVILMIIGISVVSKVSIKKSAGLFILLTLLSLTTTIASHFISPMAGM